MAASSLEGLCQAGRTDSSQREDFESINSWTKAGQLVRKRVETIIPWKTLTGLPTDPQNEIQIPRPLKSFRELPIIWLQINLVWFGISSFQWPWPETPDVLYSSGPPQVLSLLASTL